MSVEEPRTDPSERTPARVCQHALADYGSFTYYPVVISLARAAALWKPREYPRIFTLRRKDRP